MESSKQQGWRIFLSAVTVFVLLIPALASPAPVHGDTVDAVVLIDVSESMFSWFDSVEEYLVRNIVSQQLTTGDAFHLLSFADEPAYEISRKIRGEAELEEILARMMLLAPLGSHTDLVSAFKYLYDYTYDLPLETKKELFILTDGVHDPSPASPYPVSSMNDDDLASIVSSMKGNGWNVHIIYFPDPLVADVDVDSNANTNTVGSGKGTETEMAAIPSDISQQNPSGSSNNVFDGSDGDEDISSGDVPDDTVGKGNNLLGTITEELDQEPIIFDSEDTSFVYKATGQLELHFPENLGKIGRNVSFPLGISNHTDKPASIGITGLSIDGKDVLKRPVSFGVDAGAERQVTLDLRLGEDLSPGEYHFVAGIQLAQGQRAFPREGVVRATLVDGSEALFVSFPWRYLFMLIAFIAGIVLVVLLVRRSSLFSSSGEPDYTSPEAYEERQESVTAMEQDALLNGMKRKHRQYLSSVATGSGSSVSVRQAKGDSSSKRELFSREEIARAKSEGRQALELIVVGQNRLIGKRNIKWVKTTETFTIGSAGQSDFLIFLYPVPRLVGHLHIEKGSCRFNPENLERFPDLAGPLDHCLGKPIRFLVHEDLEIRFFFQSWMSPLERINRQLHVIDHPGLPEELA